MRNTELLRKTQSITILAMASIPIHQLILWQPKNLRKLPMLKITENPIKNSLQIKWNIHFESYQIIDISGK